MAMAEMIITIWASQIFHIIWLNIQPLIHYVSNPISIGCPIKLSNNKAIRLLMALILSDHFYNLIIISAMVLS